MSADSPLEAIFQAALELSDPAARAALLDRACGNDSELRRQVERLLAAHESAGGFLETPPTSLTDGDEHSSAEVEQPGAVIGPYKLLEQIGEGGMGVVFMAEQSAPVRRRVALKVVKPGMDSRQVIARFEAERQALALMDHPHIARVFDVGTTHSGRPYFVMELVRGVPLTRYCDQQQLDVRRRLELFAEVCRGIQHAHQKGVIHRDIKPSNVLVAEFDGRPTVKIIDFGIAKALDQPLTERTLFTNFGQVVGTLEYMSPEQTRLNQLDVDTRSDVYSLGVLLYELLAGSPPFERQRIQAAAFDEVLRMIREDEPPRPSTRLSGSETLPAIAASRRVEPARLSRLVRGELDWIVMRALEKERDRRYATALDMAADVDRYLANEPVAAGPPSAAYRVRKFLRRHRGWVTAATLVLLALVTGVVGTTAGWVAARRERDAKSAALAAEQAALRQAGEANRRSLAALESLTDEVVERLLLGKTEIGPEDRAFLDRVLGHLDEVAVAPGAGPAEREAQARGYSLLARWRWQLGELPRARQDYSQSIALWERLLADSPQNADYLWQLAHALSNRGSVAAAAQDPASGEADHRRAIEIYAALAAAHPHKPRYRQFLANARTNYGVMLKDVQRNVETVEQYRQALSIQEKLVADFPQEIDYLDHLAGTKNNLGLELWLANQRDEAVATLRESQALQRRIWELRSDDPGALHSLAGSYANLGGMLAELQRFDEAEQQFAEGRALFAQLIAQNPAIPDYRRTAADLMGTSSALFVHRRKWNDAATTQRQRVALLGQLHTEFPDEAPLHADLARAHDLFGTILNQAGQPAEALGEHRAAIAAWQELLANRPPTPAEKLSLGGAQGNLGTRLAEADRLEESLAAYDESRATLEPLLGDPEPPRQAAAFLLTALRGRARVLAQLGRHGEAAEAWSQAIEHEPPDRQRLARAARASSLAHTAPDEAVAEASAVSQDAQATGGELLEAARALAVASQSLAGDARAAALRLAIAALQQAKAKGQLDTPESRQELGSDAALAPLRGLPEWDNLVGEPAPAAAPAP